MAPNPTCRYCGTVPNPGETICNSESAARQCPWMGESDWKRYNRGVESARAEDAIAKAVAAERERCAMIADKVAVEWNEDAEGFAIKGNFERANVSLNHKHGAEEVAAAIRAHVSDAGKGASNG